MDAEASPPRSIASHLRGALNACRGAFAHIPRLALDIALAMFSFPSFAAYERYRKDSFGDPDVQKAIAFATETGCFIRYERSFFRPVLP